MEQEKKYSEDVLANADALAKLIAALPKEKAAGVAEVANAYLDGANACIRLLMSENSQTTA